MYLLTNLYIFPSFLHSNVINTMDNETVLVVLGDHGMTKTGNALEKM